MSTAPHSLPPSPLRYLGGKAKLASWLLDKFPPHEIYIEPFCGSAAVLLSKSPAPVEIINDLNGDVVNFFRILRHPRLAKRLADMVALTPYAETEHKKALDTFKLPPLEKARLFLFRTHANFSPDLTHTAFKCTTDPGHLYPREWHSVPARLAPTAQRLKNVTVLLRDFAEILPKYDKPGAFFYLDPPYLPDTRVQGGYKHELSEPRHRELCRLLASMQHAKWALSGYENDLYNTLLPWVEKHTTGSTTAKHSDRTEVLWCNYKQPSLFTL